MGDMTALSPAPVVDVQLFVEVLLLSFGGFRGKCLTEDQLNIDGSTPTFHVGDLINLVAEFSPKSHTDKT